MGAGESLISEVGAEFLLGEAVGLLSGWSTCGLHLARCFAADALASSST